MKAGEACFTGFLLVVAGDSLPACFLSLSCHRGTRIVDAFMEDGGIFTEKRLPADNLFSVKKLRFICAP